MNFVSSFQFLKLKIIEFLRWIIHRRVQLDVPSELFCRREIHFTAIVPITCSIITNYSSSNNNCMGNEVNTLSMRDFEFFHWYYYYEHCIHTWNKQLLYMSVGFDVYILHPSKCWSGKNVYKIKLYSEHSPKPC